MTASTAYRVYATLHSVLVKWLSEYMTLNDARRVVSLSLADMYRWACNAVPTTYGPFSDVAEVCMARALGLMSQPDSDHVAWPMATLDAQTDQFHYEVAWLYANVYGTLYEANVSLNEREAIYQMIRLHYPTLRDESTALLEIDEACCTSTLIRRVVSTMSSHACMGQLICTVTQGIWEDEHRRGRDWMIAQRSREAIAPWRESGS